MRQTSPCLNGDLIPALGLVRGLPLLAPVLVQALHLGLGSGLGFRGLGYRVSLRFQNDKTGHLETQNSKLIVSYRLLNLHGNRHQNPSTVKNL